MADDGTVRVETLAKLIDVSARRCQQLANEGIVRKAGRGTYDLAASVNGYCKYMHEVIEGRPQHNITTQLKDQQLRRAKLENDERELKLLGFDEVNAIFTETAALIVQMCNALDDRLAPMVANEQDPAKIKEIIREETSRIREASAAALSDPAASIELRGNSDPAAKKNGRRVGRRK